VNNSGLHGAANRRELRSKFAWQPGELLLGHAAFTGNSNHYGEALFHILFRSRPEETLMRIAVWPCQTVPAHQQVPFSWMRRTTSRVTSELPKDTST